MFIRGALMNGFALEQKLGTNPFKIGFIGGTDVHNSLTSIEEDNFFGKHVEQEPHPTRWSQVAKKGLGFTRYDWMHEAAGYAAVWATGNTRTALWDAMMRKECYATSGTRMTVRFFGGWDYQPEETRTRYLAEIGYRKGVPMGADLPKASADGKAPTFLVAAMKDPMGANLDRVQIIKGWLDKDGKTHEKIYDVVWGNADRRKRGANGKIPPVGDTVDVSRATWTNTIGDPELMALEGSRFQPLATHLLLCARPRDSHSSLDRLRCRALRRENVSRRADEASGASMDVTDLVYADTVKKPSTKLHHPAVPRGLCEPCSFSSTPNHRCSYGRRTDAVSLEQM